MIRSTRGFALVLLAGLGCGWMLPAWGADQAKTPDANPPAVSTETPAPPARLSRDEDYELFSVLVDTLDQVERNYVKDISRRELVEAAIQGVLNKLDPYSNYISPDDLTKFRTSVESQFGGIGIQIRADDGNLQVVTPLVGTPAYRAGLQAGDTIVEINGVSTKGIATEDAVRQLKGEVGSEVTLKVLSVGAKKPRTVNVTREVVHVETVLSDVRKGNDEWDFYLDRDLKIGYIRVTAFSRDTAGDIRDALAALKHDGIQGLILDLRFNPGGLLNSAIEVSDLFLSSGRIVSTEGRNSEPRVWDAHAPGTFEGFPMVVLVNRYSASASEIVAACLQDHARAIVIGERTWGKGSVQNVIEMEGGKSALKLTTASYKRPNGKNIHRFPNASETDEWGVSPNDGYDLKLSNGELSDLIENRRVRDIVKAKSPAVIAAAIAGAGDTSSVDKPAAEPAPATDKPADQESKNDESQADEKTPADPMAEKQNAPAEDQPAETPPATTNAPKKPAEDSPAGKFVDRQLQKGVEYLKAEIAKSK